MIFIVSTNAVGGWLTPFELNRMNRFGVNASCSLCSCGMVVSGLELTVRIKLRCDCHERIIVRIPIAT